MRGKSLHHSLRKNARRHGWKIYKIIFGSNSVYCDDHSPHSPLAEDIMSRLLFPRAVMDTGITS